MADKKDEKSIWGSLFKVLFSCLILSFALSGYFTNGSVALEDKMYTSLSTSVSAGKILGGKE